ncbi:hypothetical protein D3C85_855230 [compost metagenome]
MLPGQGFATGDAHAHRQGFPLGGQPLRQLAAVTGGEAENSDAVLTNQLADRLRVPLPLSPQHHLCTAEQRHQQTLGGGIEVDRIEMQFAVIGTHAEALDHRAAMHGDFAVGYHHALGLAGGAGGIDQVGRIQRRTDQGQLAVRVIHQSHGIPIQAPTRHTGRQFTQRLEHRRVAEQQAKATVFDHVVQAIQRVLRVQRHIGTARLENRQQPDDHFQRALQRQADPHLRADAPLTEPPGQTIGATIQLGITQGLSGEGQGRRVGARQHLLAEQVMNALVQAMFARRLRKAGQQLLLLGGVQ